MKDMEKKLALVYKTYDYAQKEAVVEFLPQPSDKTLAEPCSACLAALLAGWKTCLGPVFSKLTDDQLLAKTLISSGQHLQVLDSMASSVRISKAIFCEQDERFKMVAQLQTFVAWIIDLHHVVAGNFKIEYVQAYVTIRSGMAAALAPLGDIGGMDFFFQLGMEDLKASPLLDPRGAVLAKLRACASRVAKRYSEPIVNGCGEVIKFAADIGSDSDIVNLASLPFETVKALVVFSVPEKDFRDLVAWAASTCDEQLSLQLTCLFQIFKICPKLGACETACRPIRAATGYEDTKIGIEAVRVLGELRDCTATCHATLAKEGSDQCFSKRSGTSFMIDHANFFDSKVDAFKAGKTLLQCSLALQSEYGDRWTKNAEALAELLSSFQPAGWMLAKEDLFSNDEVCRALLANMDGYKKTGALVSEAKATLKLLKQLAIVDSQFPGATPILVDVSTQKKLKTLSADGIQLVCFTYAVHFVRKEIPEYGNEKIAQGVTSIRSKFNTHGVDITDQLNEILTNLEAKGTIAAAPYLLPASVGLSAAAVSASACIGASPASNCGKAPSPASAASPAASALGATSPAAGGPEPMAKKQRLADRLRSREQL